MMWSFLITFISLSTQEWNWIVTWNSNEQCGPGILGCGSWYLNGRKKLRECGSHREFTWLPTQHKVKHISLYICFSSNISSLTGTSCKVPLPNYLHALSDIALHQCNFLLYPITYLRFCAPGDEILIQSSTSGYLNSFFFISWIFLSF